MSFEASKLFLYFVTFIPTCKKIKFVAYGINYYYNLDIRDKKIYKLIQNNNYILFIGDFF